MTSVVQKKPGKGGFEGSGLQEWLGAGSNRRHMDFQSIALPTELPVRSLFQEVLGKFLLITGLCADLGALWTADREG